MTEAQDSIRARLETIEERFCRHYDDSDPFIYWADDLIIDAAFLLARLQKERAAREAAEKDVQHLLDTCVPKAEIEDLQARLTAAEAALRDIKTIIEEHPERLGDMQLRRILEKCR